MKLNRSSPPVTPPPATNLPRFIIGNRLRGLLVAGPCLTMLIVALTLQPRNAGYGTAQRLGLPQCSVLLRTGYPCPTCGMTTSVSAAVRGR